MEFLSLKNRLSSRINVETGPHVRPPSAERLTSIAFAEPAVNDPPLEASAIWNAAPSGAKVTLETDGPDEVEAIDALVALIADCFGEGQ